jgi:DUF4097 and DUF4098 domain-containing protein YvlB
MKEGIQMSHTIDFSNDFSASEISSVFINSAVCELTVCPSKDNAAHVKCKNVPNGSFAEVTDSTLHIEVKKQSMLKSVFKNPLKNPTCTVALPKKTFDTFTVKAGVGNKKISDVTCREAFVDSGVGNTVIEGLRPQEALKLKSGSGNVKADIPQCGKAEISTGTGNTSVNCCATGLNVKGGTGNINISGTVNGDIVLKGGVGTLTFDGTANGDLTASSGVGNINLLLHEDPANAEKHNIKTSHGIGKVIVEYVP